MIHSMHVTSAPLLESEAGLYRGVVAAGRSGDNLELKFVTREGKGDAAKR